MEVLPASILFSPPREGRVDPAAESGRNGVLDKVVHFRDLSVNVRFRRNRHNIEEGGIERVAEGGRGGGRRWWGGRRTVRIQSVGQGRAATPQDRAIPAIRPLRPRLIGTHNNVVRQRVLSGMSRSCRSALFLLFRVSVAPLSMVCGVAQNQKERERERKKIQKKKKKNLPKIIKYATSHTEEGQRGEAEESSSIGPRPGTPRPADDGRGGLPLARGPSLLGAARGRHEGARTPAAASR